MIYLDSIYSMKLNQNASVSLVISLLSSYSLNKKTKAQVVLEDTQRGELFLNDPLQSCTLKIFKAL